MTSDMQPRSRLDARRSEQTPQALARLVVVGLFSGLWFVLWLARIPMPVPFLLVLLVEAWFFVLYWRIVFVLPTVRSVELAQYGMLAAEIVFHTTMVYFLGGISWLGAFAYVFGLIFANTFLDLRRGLVYTSGASLAFAALILLEATGVIPHYVYLEQGPLRYADPRFVATTIIAGFGVFLSVYAWVNWVGHQLRQERDAAVRAQDDLLQARAELQKANEALEERVTARTAELELANAALRESEERLRTVVSSAPIVLFALDCEGMFTLSEGKGLEALGLKPGEVVGLSVFDVYRDVPAILDNMRRALAGEAFTATVDVAELAFETHYTPIRDDGGEVTGVIGVATDITERKRAEEALRESEEHFRFLAEHAQDIIFRYRVATPRGYEYVSPAITAVSGYTPEQFYADPDFDFKIVHPDDRETLDRNSRDLRADPIELRWIRKDGSIIFTEERNVPIYDESGNLVAIEGIVRDITERKQAEEALRESEEVLRATIEATADGILVVATNGQVAYANARFAEMWRIPEELLEDRDDERLLAFVLDQLEEPEAFLSKVRKLYQTTLEDFDTLLFRDGRVFERYSRPLLREGEMAGRVWSFRDITERRRAEEALRKLGSAVEQSIDGIAVADMDGIIQFANPSWVRLHGYSVADVLGKHLSIFHTDDQLQNDVLPVIEQVKKAGAHQGEVGHVRKDGTTFPTWMTVTLLRNEREHPIGFVGIAHDITERKRAEEALRERALRDPLTGTLNHAAIVEELRGLLAESTGTASHAVAMVDVDGLKAINDTYGHQLGDAVLVSVAEALSRDGTIVGRYGGDEFVAVLCDADRQAAERYRTAVLDALAGAPLTDPETGTKIPVIASIGLAIYPAEAKSIDDLIRLSDSAMYASRRQRPVDLTGETPPRPLRDDRAAKMVGEIVPLLTSPGDLSDKLRLVSHRLSVGAGYDAVDFTLFAPDPGAPVAQNTFAQGPNDLVEAWNREQRDDSSEAHPIRLLFERAPRPVILDDPWNDDLLLEGQRDILRAAKLRSVLVAPMIWQDQVVGSLGVASRREAAFTPRDAQFLAAVAAQVTAIVRMETLVAELQSSAARLLQARAETVMLLAAAAEARDHTTGLHLQSVRALGEALARALGGSEEDAAELGLAAVLHDIGKIRVPDSILTSSGQLAEEEWELMKQHTTWGAEFLAGRPGFELAATIARAHHERWDGSGYPNGLSGDAIPEAAAIVAVADAFDAIINDRPYRRGRSVTRAVREIVAGSGTQFSPNVVDALVRLHRRKQLPLTPARSSTQAA